MKKRHPNLVKIGRKIREARKSRGLSQEDFAGLAQLGRTYLGRIERGEQNLSIQSLIQIAFALQVELQELVLPLAQLEAPSPDDDYYLRSLNDPESH